MSWDREFKSQSYGMTIHRHRKLPIYTTIEFDFYRCVEFKSDFYEKTASWLFNGNLRECTGRYSKLFPSQKISYWADGPETARAEIKKHGAGNDILTFWAYDDGTSTFPTLTDQSPLVIIDGRKCGAQDIIDKVDNGIILTAEEQEYMSALLAEDPDCLVFDSHAKEGGENFIFFEKGFKKLALRELRLRFGREHGGNDNKIVCAGTSDYTPYIESYGEYFAPKAKVKMDTSYLSCEEYLLRKNILEQSYRKFRGDK